MAKSNQTKGWLDNYNDYNVSAPEGFRGDGYSNVGRTTSPAWGGQFQMGGVLPGAVGHMYARHGAPSEGKYAKKTLPSVQNGKEMQYYQNGLDFQPKTISKNGAWLDKAQTGAKKFKLKDERELVTKPAESTNVKKKNFDLEQSKSNKTYLNQLAEQQKENKRRKALTQDQREREDYNARNEQAGSIQAPVQESKWDRTKAIVSNPLTAFGYAARNESLPTRFQHGERNTLDNAIDWVNPLQGIASASEIPGELGRGEYLNAGLSALDAVDLGVYAKGAMKASKPFLQKGVQQLGNVRTSISPELRQGLQTNGFLDMFKSKPKSQIDWGKWNKEIPENSQLMDEYNTIEQTSKANNTWMKNPDGSSFQGTPEQFVQQNSENFKKAYPEGYKTVYRGMPYDNPLLLQKENFTGVFTGDKNLAKGYGSNLYELGLKNSNNSISFNANGDDWLDLRFANRDVVTQQKNIDFNKKYLNDLITKEGNSERVVNMKENILRSEKALRENKNALNNQKYQKLTNSFKDESVVITDDIAQYLEKEKLDNIQINNVLDGEFGDINISNQVPGNYLKSLKGNNGMFDMTNPNIYKAVVPGAIGLGALQQKKDGGIIKDDRGQWDHPGEITEIGSNEITMQGVPYNVLGVSDTGDVKLMKPGKDYKFKGKKVTEYPMAKNGVNQQDQKTLQHIDQLTNFTNYNTKQSGGWLDQY